MWTPGVSEAAACTGPPNSGWARTEARNSGMATGTAKASSTRGRFSTPPVRLPLARRLTISQAFLLRRRTERQRFGGCLRKIGNVGAAIAGRELEHGGIGVHLANRAHPHLAHDRLGGGRLQLGPRRRQ